MTRRRIADIPDIPEEAMDPVEALTDEHRGLLKVIRGEGKYSVLGKGLHTYPGKDDKNNQQLHSACVDLERAGFVCRQIDKPEHVLWMPAGELAEVVEVLYGKKDS